MKAHDGLKDLSISLQVNTCCGQIFQTIVCFAMTRPINRYRYFKRRVDSRMVIPEIEKVAWCRASTWGGKSVA